MYSPFNNGTQMTPMRQITADLFFWQRNKRTYFSFDSMFFYITAQSRRSCWTRFSISPRAFTFPRPRPDPELKLTLFNLLTLGIPNQAWLCSRLTANFRMTLGGSFYFYTHFGEANSILLSNLKSHRSSFIIHRSSLTAHNSQLITHPPTIKFHLQSVPRHPRWFVSCARYYIM